MTRSDVAATDEARIHPLRSARLMAAIAGSLVLSLSVTVTAWETNTPLGAPLYWPWLLTGLQVVALWSAGSHREWGWLLGAAVQPPWIAYALVTGQMGFIPGCAISAVVQTFSFLRTHGGPSMTRWHPRLSQVEELGLRSRT